MDAGGTTIEVDRTPTPEEEFETFDPEEARARKLRNDSDQQDMEERQRYAGHAYGITQTWVGFLIVLTFTQLCLKPQGYVNERPVSYARPGNVLRRRTIPSRLLVPIPSPPSQGLRAPLVGGSVVLRDG